MKNPISLDGLVSWLERQDPAVRYEYEDPFDCLLCRYFRAVGLPVNSIGTAGWDDTAWKEHPLPADLNIVSALNSTYGGALAYARELLAAERTA